MDRIHVHDCSQCIFLGRYLNYDLYFCNQSINLPTVIARWSSNGPDYYSGLSFSKPYKSIDGNTYPPIEPLKVARELAEEKGLLQS